MPGGVSFADVLEEKLGTIHPDRPVRRAQPTYRPLPPNPFLFVEPQRRFWATAYSSMGRTGGASREAPPPASPAVPSATLPPIAPLRPARPTRQLTSLEQRALNELVGLGVNLASDFTAAELRSAFRSLARRYHPDSHPASNAAEAARLSRLFADLSVHYRRLLAVLEPARVTQH